MTTAEIAQLYEQYGFLIYGRCKRILHSHDDARDAVQVVFLQLLQCYGTLRDSQKVVSWIYRTAQNYCFNFLRDHKKFSDEVEVDAIARESGTESKISSRQLIRLAMECQDKKIREVVYYTHVEELNQAEIQKITGQSPATIRRNLRRFEASIPALKTRLGL